MMSVCREVVAATVGAGAGWVATCVGASVVAGEGTGGAEAWVAGEDCAITAVSLGEARVVADAFGEVSAMAGVVSTTGDPVAVGSADNCSGLAGEPLAEGAAAVAGTIPSLRLSAKRPFGEAAAAVSGFVSGAVSVAGATVDVVVSGLDSFACLLDANRVPGMGLGSIAGLDSAWADITVAASAAGAGPAATVGLCIQPRS